MTNSIAETAWSTVLAIGFGGQLVASVLAAQRSSLLAAANLAIAMYIFYAWWRIDKMHEKATRHHG